MTFDKVVLPAYLSFQGVTTDSIIDLGNPALSSAIDMERVYCQLNLLGAPIDKINFTYEDFRLAYPEVKDLKSFEKVNKLYQEVLKKFMDNGQASSYEVLDKEFQELSI